MVKSQVYERLYYFSAAARQSALHISLMSTRAKVTIFNSDITVITFFLNTPVRSASRLVRFETMSCFRSPRLKRGSRLRFSDTFQLKDFFFFFFLYFIVSDCRSSLIAFESVATGPFPSCVCAVLRVCSLVLFDSLSVRLMFLKVDTRAPCNAVFTEPPRQVSARCIRGTEGPDEITQFRRCSF